MWLYIFENGAFYQSPIGPTHEDIIAFKDGHLTILTFCKDTNQFYELDLYEQYIPVPISPVSLDSHHPGKDNYEH